MLLWKSKENYVTFSKNINDQYLNRPVFTYQPRKRYLRSFLRINPEENIILEDQVLENKNTYRIGKNVNQAYKYKTNYNNDNNYNRNQSTSLYKVNQDPYYRYR